MDAVRIWRLSICGKKQSFCWNKIKSKKKNKKRSYMICCIAVALDWFQSLKQIFINVSSYTCSQSNSDGSVLTEPSELDWLQVYDNDTLIKIVLRTGGPSQSTVAPARLTLSAWRPCV